jgi:hypothetical protein
MTTPNDKLIDAIVSLNRGTQEGRITWAVKKPTPTLSLTDPQIAVQAVYETEHGGRKLRLYEAPYNSPNLEIIDDDGTSLWTFPPVSGLDDLLSSVRYETAGVKKFLDGIIAEEGLEPETEEMSHSR